VATTAALGCDGAISVDGHVYARADGDARRSSVAVVDALAPDTSGLVPLAGATIYVFQSPRDTASANPDTVLWKTVVSSGADGSFHAWDMSSPFPFTALLRVRKSGYRGVDLSFRHSRVRPPHNAIIVLTPLPGSPARP
jgi:hypothetical protein